MHSDAKYGRQCDGQEFIRHDAALCCVLWLGSSMVDRAAAKSAAFSTFVLY